MHQGHHLKAASRVSRAWGPRPPALLSDVPAPRAPEWGCPRPPAHLSGDVPAVLQAHQDRGARVQELHHEHRHLQQLVDLQGPATLSTSQGPRTHTSTKEVVMQASTRGETVPQAQSVQGCVPRPAHPSAPSGPEEVALPDTPRPTRTEQRVPTWPGPGLHPCPPPTTGKHPSPPPKANEQAQSPPTCGSR